MFINHLHIQNFKNIKEVDLIFKKISLISGDTGSGKTAILEAINLLLCDYLEDKFSEYVRWGAKKFDIQANFNHLGFDYDYSITADKSTKRLLKVGADEYNNSDAPNFLKSIINPEITLYSNISLQGKSTQLLFEKPTARLEKLKTIFGLNDIGIVIEKIKTDIAQIKENIKIIDTELSVLRNRSFQYQDVPKLDDITELKNEVANLILKRDLYISQAKLYEVYKEDLEKYTNVQKSIQEIEELLKKHTSQLSVYQEKVVPDYDVEKHKQLKLDLQEFEKRIIHNENQIANNQKLHDEIKILEKKIESIQKDIDKCSVKRIKPLDTQEQMLQNLELSISSLSAKIMVLKDQVKIAKQGKCPTCHQEFKADVESLEKSLLESMKQLEIDKKEFTKYKDEVDKYNKDIEQNNSNKEKRTIYEVQIQEMTEKIKVLKNDIDEHANDLYKDNRKYLIKLLKQEEDLNKIEKEYNEVISYNNSFQVKRNEIEKDMAVLQSKIDTLQEIKKPADVEEPEKFDLNYFEAQQRKLHVHEEKVAEVERIKLFNETVKQEEKKNILAISAKETETLELKNKMSNLENAKKVLDKDFSSYLIDNGTEFIKLKMNEIFGKSYGKYNITLQRDNKGIDFFYSDENNRITSVNMASGFERQLLSMAFRMSLSYLQKLGIFIFDEVDSDASDEKSMRMFQTILNLPFSQIVCISHKESTKQFLSNLSDCKVFEMCEGKINE